MINLTRDPVVLAAVYALILQTTANAQKVLWEMDARRFDQPQLGEIRPRNESRLESFSNPRSVSQNKSTFLTERPPVIDLGPFSSQRSTPGERPMEDR